MTEPIKLMMLDVDGCITPGEGLLVDLDVIRQLAGFNRAAETDPAVPRVSLCTGRQQPFVDLMCQFIGASAPAVYENGSGLHCPDTFEFIPHPIITDDLMAELAMLRSAVERDVVKTGKGRLQPGKELSLSVYPSAPLPVDELGAITAGIVDKYSLPFEIDVSILCVNLFFKGIDKGEGLKQAARRAGLELKNIGGVGDGPGDASYLKIVGFSATPANGHESIKPIVDYVAEQENGRGTVEIIKEVIRRNRAL